MPGIRKVLKGVPSSNSSDQSNLPPLGSEISIQPPYIPPNPRNNSNNTAKILRKVFKVKFKFYMDIR